MNKRQYCASAYIIDFSNHNVLLMYNTKLKNGFNLGIY